MKKLFFLITISFLAQGLFAQMYENAVGLRLGGSNNGTGFELTYQSALSNENRLELSIGTSNLDQNGYHYSYSNITGIYQWVHSIQPAINWYYGVGAEIGQYSDGSDASNNGSSLNIGGQIGAEYDFNLDFLVPILVSLDVRPMVKLLGKSDNMGFSTALGIKYTF